MLARVEIEAGFFPEQPGLDLRVLEPDLGLLEQILRAAQLELGNHAALEHALVDLDLAERGLAIDLRLRDQLRAVRAAVLDLETRAADPGFETGERRLLLEEAALEIRARDRGEQLAGLHRIARTNMKIDRAGGDRVERGTVRRHHAAIVHDIAGQGAARDLRDPHARAIDRALGTEPGAQHVAAAGDHDEHDHGAGDPSPPRPADGRLGEGTIGGGRIANHDRTKKQRSCPV